MSAVVCGKRASSYFEEFTHATGSPPAAKRARCVGSASPSLPTWPRDAADSALIADLSARFPAMSLELIEKALEESGNDLDSAIKSLLNLHLESVESNGDPACEPPNQITTEVQVSVEVLKGQMAYLEEWSLLERDYADSLSGIVEALTATILCLPVTDGAKADIQDVQNAVGFAVDIMQTIGSSICTLLAKLAGTSILVSDLAKIATQERILMEQSRELLSTLASMHVKYCSLQGQRVQTTRRRFMHS